MADRNVYVYRLDVVYPTPTPERWDKMDPEMQSWFEAEGHTPQWPAVRQYLSLSGATGRARLLRRLGATVTIRRSQPVIFDD